MQIEFLKATNGMCSHSLLAATLNGQVDSFVAHFIKSWMPVNYANLGQHGLPAGGNKPSKRKASSKKMTSAVKNILAIADGIQWIKRAKTSQYSTLQPASQQQACLTKLRDRSDKRYCMHHWKYC